MEFSPECFSDEGNARVLVLGLHRLLLLVARLNRVNCVLHRNELLVVFVSDGISKPTRN